MWPFNYPVIFGPSKKKIQRVLKRGDIDVIKDSDIQLLQFTHIVSSGRT